MTYKPTGRPPGRPRTKPVEVKPAGLAEPEFWPATPDRFPPNPGQESVLHMANGRLCKTCYPDGWPEGAVGLSCPHGGPYVRRLPS